jgi:hypothetical protein
MSGEVRTSTILARRVRREMQRVRQTKGNVMEEFDRVVKVRRLKSATNEKEYPVILHTIMHPEGLHYGPGERVEVLS